MNQSNVVIPNELESYLLFTWLKVFEFKIKPCCGDDYKSLANLELTPLAGSTDSAIFLTLSNFITLYALSNAFRTVKSSRWILSVSF